MNTWILAATLMVSGAIYASLWTAIPLTWDDHSNIFSNPYYTMNHWWGILSAPYFGLYVPVTSLAWAGLYYLGGGQPWPFRVFNILVHSANIVLVFFLLRELARRWRMGNSVAIGFATALFALHPLQVESVAWISGGRDLLSTFFALFAVLIYFRSSYLAATLLFALALFSKPSVAILPAVIWAVDVFMCKRDGRKAALRMSLWVALALIAIVLTRVAQVEHFTNRVEWWQRPFVMLDGYMFYLQKLVWPFPLAGNYGRTPDKTFADSSLLWLDVLRALPVLALLAWAWRRDRRYLIFGLWFLVLLPVSGVIPFGYEVVSHVADHYMYLPMVVIAATLMLAFGHLHRRLLIVPAVLSVFWAWTSWERTSAWMNDETFFSDMAKSAPDSYNTAIGMSVVLCKDKKDYDGGLQWIDKALALRKDDIIALSNRAYCLFHAGRLREVIEIDLDPLNPVKLTETQPTAYSSLLATLGTAYIERQEYETGFNFLCDAYRVKPAEPTHAANLKIALELLKKKGLNPSCPTLVH